MRTMKTCPVCGLERKHLSLHMKMHLEEQYSCNMCGQKFRHYSRLQTHRSRAATTGSYKCPSCCEVFQKQKSLIIHISHMHKKGIHVSPPGSFVENTEEEASSVDNVVDSVEPVDNPVDTYEAIDNTVHTDEPPVIKEEPVFIKPEPEFFKPETRTESVYKNSAEESGYVENKTSDESLPDVESSPPHQMVVNPYLTDEIVIFDSPVQGIETDKVKKCYGSDSNLTIEYSELEDSQKSTNTMPASVQQLKNTATSSHTDTLNNTHICDICERSFASEAFLLAHQTHAKKLLPYQCDFCCNSFDSNYSLVAHMKFVHSHAPKTVTPGTTNAHGSSSSVKKSPPSCKPTPKKESAKKKFKKEDEVKCEVCHKKISDNKGLTVCQPCLTLFRQFRQYIDTNKNVGLTK